METRDRAGVRGRSEPFAASWYKRSHSCVVQLARAEYTVPEIASIIDRSLSSINTILTTNLAPNQRSPEPFK